MKKQFKRGTNWSELKRIGKALCNPTTKALNKFNPKLLWIGRNQFGGGFREINNDLRCMSEIIDDELKILIEYYGYLVMSHL